MQEGWIKIIIGWIKLLSIIILNMKIELIGRIHNRRRKFLKSQLFLIEIKVKSWRKYLEMSKSITKLRVYSKSPKKITSATNPIQILAL